MGGVPHDATMYCRLTYFTNEAVIIQLFQFVYIDLCKSLHAHCFVILLPRSLECTHTCTVRQPALLLDARWSISFLSHYLQDLLFSGECKLAIVLVVYIH